MSSPQRDYIPRGLWCSPDCWGLGLCVFDVDEGPLFEGGANWKSQRGSSPLFVLLFSFYRKYMFFVVRRGRDHEMDNPGRCALPCHPHGLQSPQP